MRTAPIHGVIVATALALPLLSPGCGAEERSVTSAAEAEALPHSAAEIAREMIAGRTGTLLEVRRFRFHPAAHAIGRFGRWGDVVETIGLDPLEDVDRAFVTSAHALDDVSVIVLELAISDDEVREAMFARGAKADAPFPKVTLDFSGERRVVALVRPGLLVAVPSWLEDRLRSLTAATALPPPEGQEAARFFAFDPPQSLGTMPKWPDSVISARAEVAFTPVGAARVTFEALSTSPEQARLDAAEMKATTDDLLTLDFALFEMDLLDPLTFTTEGRAIRMETTLLPGDVDWVLGYTGQR
jgi:hypothetical protein